MRNIPSVIPEQHNALEHFQYLLKPFKVACEVTAEPGKVNW